MFLEISSVTSMDNLNFLIADNLNILQELVHIQFNILDLNMSHLLVHFVEYTLDFLWFSPCFSPDIIILIHKLLLYFFKFIYRQEDLFEFLIALKKIDNNLIVFVSVDDPILMFVVDDRPLLPILLIFPFRYFFINLIDYFIFFCYILIRFISIHSFCFFLFYSIFFMINFEYFLYFFDFIITEDLLDEGIYVFGMFNLVIMFFQKEASIDRLPMHLTEQNTSFNLLLIDSIYLMFQINFFLDFFIDFSFDLHLFDSLIFCNIVDTLFCFLFCILFCT